MQLDSEETIKECYYCGQMYWGKTPSCACEDEFDDEDEDLDYND